MEASVASSAAPAAPAEQADEKQPEAVQTEQAAPVAPEPVADDPVTPGTVHLIDGKSVDIESIEHFLQQMAGDAGEAWVKAKRVGGDVISFLKSAVVAHE